MKYLNRKRFRIGMVICCIVIFIALIMSIFGVIPETRLFKILTYGLLGLISILIPIIIPISKK